MSKNNNNNDSQHLWDFLRARYGSKSSSRVSIHVILKTILSWATIIIPILQMRKLRRGEFMILDQCHTANQWRKGFIFRGSGSRAQPYNFYAKLSLIPHNNSWTEWTILLRSGILLSHTGNGSVLKHEKSYLNFRNTKKLHTHTHTLEFMVILYIYTYNIIYI